MVAHVDQQLGKITGVICDLCNKSLIDKFTYFSARLDAIEVDRAMGKGGIVKQDKRALDLDICPDCLDGIKARVIDNINKRQAQGVWSTQQGQAGPVQHTQSLDGAKHDVPKEVKQQFTLTVKPKEKPK